MDDLTIVVAIACCRAVPRGTLYSCRPELFPKCNISNVALIWRETQGVLAMATQIVMDHNGDSRHTFDPKDAKALLKAEERFRELTGSGFTAAVRTASGEPVVTHRFDPTAEETLFFPRLVGG
jgi:hypothetical protein